MLVVCDWTVGENKTSFISDLLTRWVHYLFGWFTLSLLRSISFFSPGILSENRAFSLSIRHVALRCSSISRNLRFESSWDSQSKILPFSISPLSPSTSLSSRSFPFRAVVPCLWTTSLKFGYPPFSSRWTYSSENIQTSKIERFLSWEIPESGWSR